MSELHTIVEEALGAWAGVRQNAIDELRNIPEDKFSWVPGEGGRTILATAQHIVQSGLILGGETLRPDGSFRRVPFAQLFIEHAPGLKQAENKDEVVELLRTTGESLQARFRAIDHKDLFEQMIGMSGQKTTRFSMLHFISAHEYYHVGQIAMSARALGVVPMITQRILARSQS